MGNSLKARVTSLQVSRQAITLSERCIRHIFILESKCYWKELKTLIRKFLKMTYKKTQETAELAIHALFEVVESRGKNIEVAVLMTQDHGLQQLEEVEIDAVVAGIEAEAAKKAPSTKET